jgi:hypothetical protein
MALFIWLIIRFIQLVFSAGTVFFSHKKSVNSIFQPAYNSSRTAPMSFICPKEKYRPSLKNDCCPTGGELSPRGASLIAAFSARRLAAQQRAMLEHL